MGPVGREARRACVQRGGPRLEESGRGSGGGGRARTGADVAGPPALQKCSVGKLHGRVREKQRARVFPAVRHSALPDAARARLHLLKVVREFRQLPGSALQQLEGESRGRGGARQCRRTS